ncbi:putative nuclease HARBI1 [Acropora muricata]|uniref:putative nuclease HARBI1 n=1 Tax=Acropora muricata TaxID=159855 RepID=UPI0034E48F56
MVETLYEIRNEYIKFPETEAETVAATGTFAELSELPNIVGAIDGSHVKIKAPKDSAVDYFSRYQQHDFIIQAVVNGLTLFLDFACAYPGSMHDARVLRRSAIFGRAGDGDEIKFNKELSSARVKVECAFGLLKSGWRVLQKRFDSGIDAVKTAIACAVLHNLCIRWGDDWEEDDDDDSNPCPPNAGPSVRDGDNMREILKDYICN